MPAASKPTDDDARGLALGIAARLGLAADFVQATYEDPLDRLVKDGELPENIDPSDPKLDDPAERARRGAAGRERCRTRFRPEHAARTWLETVDSARSAT